MSKFLAVIFAVAFAGGIVAEVIDLWQEREEARETAASMEENIDRKINLHIPYGIYEQYFKRFFDFFLSSIALVGLSPVLLVTAALVRVKLGSPVLFTQERPGRNEKIFRLYKFRSMTDEKDSEGKLLPDEERLTGFGRMLRSTSLDELPELVNILRGDMSVVGPRPLLVKYLDRYNERQRHRHDIRPGLTGLAQTSGRNSISWEDKFEEDVKYANNITFLGDCRILLDTLEVVVRQRGIHSETSATMEEFMGNGYVE